MFFDGYMAAPPTIGSAEADIPLDIDCAPAASGSIATEAASIR
jgi:hypothetical protein